MGNLNQKQMQYQKHVLFLPQNTSLLLLQDVFDMLMHMMGFLVSKKHVFHPKKHSITCICFKCLEVAISSQKHTLLYPKTTPCFCILKLHHYSPYKHFRVKLHMGSNFKSKSTCFWDSKVRPYSFITVWLYGWWFVFKTTCFSLSKARHYFILYAFWRGGNLGHENTCFEH